MTTTTTRLTWHRDPQGLHAQADNGELTLYVRRDGNAWRFGIGENALVGDTWYSTAKPIQWQDTADTQKMAKAVAQAFSEEPWSDGGPQRRITRAILKAY